MPDSAPITLFRCRTCPAVWYFARRYCPSCGADVPEITASSGIGVVRAVTTVHRASDRSPPARHLFLVDLDDGVRVMGAGPCEHDIGRRVRGRLRRIGALALPYFEEWTP